MSFGVLALIGLAGLAGPVLGAGRNAFVPAVIGEILAGVIVGRTGLDAVDPTDPTVQFLGDVGFAMLMFTVGAHIPLRDPRLGASTARSRLAACCCSPRSEVSPPRGLPAPGTPRSTRSFSARARPPRS